MRAIRDDLRDVRCFERLVRGDKAALAELYDAHAAALYRHAVSLTRHPAEAEDLVQIVFVKLASTGAPLLAVRRPAPYLHRILHTAWIDARRHPSLSHETALDPETARVAAGTTLDPAMALDATRALSALPESQREIVHLHLIEGFSFREAGQISGVATFTAASRYRLALQRLRERMGK